MPQNLGLCSLWLKKIAKTVFCISHLTKTETRFKDRLPSETRKPSARPPAASTSTTSSKCQHHRQGVPAPPAVSASKPLSRALRISLVQPGSSRSSVTSTSVSNTTATTFPNLILLLTPLAKAGTDTQELPREPLLFPGSAAVRAGANAGDIPTSRVLTPAHHHHEQQQDFPFPRPNTHSLGLSTLQTRSNRQPRNRKTGTRP